MVLLSHTCSCLKDIEGCLCLLYFFFSFSSLYKTVNETYLKSALSHVMFFFASLSPCFSH